MQIDRPGASAKLQLRFRNNNSVIVPLGSRFHVSAHRGCVLFCTVTETRADAEAFAATVERLTDYEPLNSRPCDSEPAE